MSAQLAMSGMPDSTGFARLRALALRGYKPCFDSNEATAGFVSVRLVHPRRTRRDTPPSLMLWNDGTIATTGVLWPQLFVPTEDGPPGWQKYILAADDKTFTKFAASIATPTSIDLYLSPFLRNVGDMTKRLAIGSILCAAIAGSVMIIKLLL